MKNKKNKIIFFFVVIVSFFLMGFLVPSLAAETTYESGKYGSAGYGTEGEDTTTKNATKTTTEATKTTTTATTSSSTYQNQEKIPGSAQTTNFVTYLKSIINFGFAIIGILALFMLLIGAYQYLMAAGSDNASGAKETISSALLGLLLGLCAWVILNKINPDLVSMREPSASSATSSSAASTAATAASTASNLSGVNCAAVKNYDGFMNKKSSDLYNENIKSAQDLQNAFASFRTTGPNGLTKYSDTIYQSCKDNKVPYWYMLGTFAHESSMFYEYRANGDKYGCSASNNPGCMKSNGKTTYYSTPEEGIKANIENMGSLIKSNDTPLGAWNKWYWPDGSGNCAGAQSYLDKFKSAATATGLSGT